MVTSHLLLSHLYFLIGQERGWAWPPQQLAETVFVILLQQPTLEGPQPEGIVHLKDQNKDLDRMYTFPIKNYEIMTNYTSPCDSTRRQRSQHIVQWDPIQRLMPCNARQCSSWCSLKCPQTQELHSC